MQILVFETSIRHEKLELFLGDCTRSKPLKLTDGQAEDIRSIVNAALENDKQSA